ANSDFWNRLTHELLGRLKFTIPNLQIYSPKLASFEKLGLGLDNRGRTTKNAYRRIYSLSVRVALSTYPVYMDDWTLDVTTNN
nr:hypothetical protein [Sediminibacterium sp.]